MSNANTFPEWLQAEIDLRGWNRSELSRRSGVNGGYISMLLNGQRAIGNDSARAIARALGMAEEEVLSRAGLLTQKGQREHSEQENVLLREFRRLTEEERRIILAQVRGLNAVRSRLE